MPIKGFAPVGSSNAPSVRVVFQKPREDNPFSSIKDKKKQEKIKQELSGLWWLGGLFALVWVVNNMKPGGGSLGDLRRVGKAANMNGFAQAPESAAVTDARSHFTVGDTARFKVDEGNAEKVQKVLRSFLDEAVTNPYMTDAAAEILRRGNTDFGGDELTKAAILHDFVNNQMGVIPDPQGFENVVSPDELMARWFEVEAAGGNPKEVGEDCVAGHERVLVVRRNTGANGGGQYYDPTPIRFVKEGEQVLSFNFDRHCFEPRRVTKVWDKGPRPTVRVVLTNGATAEMTPEHRVYTGFQTGRHQFNEVAAQPFDEFWSGKRSSFSYNHRGKSGRELSLMAASSVPTFGKTTAETLDRSWVEGLYLAEGYGGHDERTRVAIANDDPVVISELHRRLTKLRASFRQSKRTLHGYTTVQAGELSWSLLMLGTHSWNKGLIPERHFGRSSAELAELLSGHATGDGHFTKSSVTHTTTSETLARDLMLAGMLTGRPTSLSYIKHHRGVGKHGLWRVYCRTGGAKYGHTPPLGLYGHKRQVNRNLRALRLDRVEPAGTQGVWDISVEGNHNFVLADSGMVVHNCDSKALLLCTLYLVSGIGAQVVLYDVNGDTYLDHAAVVATIDGQEVYAETVAPGMPLGEAPEILGTTTLTV